MFENENDSFNTRPAYGVSFGPIIVAVHKRRLPSLGKALTPGVGDIISDMSSDCNLIVAG